MNIPYVMRKCTKCGEWKVASAVNFYRNKTGKYGLKAICKKCQEAYKKEYRQSEKGKELIKKYNQKYQQTEKYKELQKKYNQEYRQSEKGKELQKKYNQSEKYKELQKKYRQTEKYKEYQKKYQREYQQVEKNKEAQKKRQQKYNQSKKGKEAKKRYNQSQKGKEANRKYSQSEKSKEYRKKYYQTPQGQIVIFNANNKRRTQEQAQGSGITKEEWREMMSFFDWKCAYSGATLSKGTRSIDHIIPINKGGENEIWNCVPMLRRYNSSKNDKDLMAWYKEQPYYSETRLAKIREWQEYALDKWGDE